MFGKTYQLSLTRNYVRHWGVEEAVRELIQNALDSESPFIYEVDREDNGLFTLSLISEHSQLTPQSLLLGATTKAENEHKIGSFGEGYKIAMLVLAREGFPISIWNGDKCWSPYFQYSKTFDEDVLCVQENALTFKNRGLRFLVSNLDENQVNAIRESCLQMQSHIGAIKSTSKGEILLEKPGKLYVGGLYICDTDLKFGYNVKPEHLRLERDRKTVDGWDLKCLSRDMWYETDDLERVARMIEEEVPDLEYARYSSTELVREACYRIFREKNPGAIVAKSNEELKEFVRRGMTNVVVVHGAWYEQITSSRSYRSEVRVAAPPTPTERMTAWYAVNKYHIHADSRRSFDDLLKESRNWRIK